MFVRPPIQPEVVQDYAGLYFVAANPNIISTIVETGLFGILFILCPMTMYVLMRRPEQSSLSSSRSIHKVVVVVCALQFCFTTAVRILELVKLFPDRVYNTALDLEFSVFHWLLGIESPEGIFSR